MPDLSGVIPPRARLRTVVGAAALASVLLLAGCASSSDPAPTSSTPSTPPSADPTPTATSDTVEPVARPEDLTCESLIAPDVVAAFAQAGWEPQEAAFRIGSRELADGLWCTWGVAGDETASVQIYGWAGIDRTEAAAAQKELTDAGWVAEESPDGLYVTENRDTAVTTDEDGYGMTFLFGNGWVAASDTKQGLLVIQLPA